MIKSKNHLQRVANLPCCICHTTGVQVHHLRHPAITGAGLKASDWLTLPLCPACHAHFHAIGRETWERLHGSQIEYITQTLHRLYN